MFKIESTRIGMLSKFFVAVLVVALLGFYIMPANLASAAEGDCNHICGDGLCDFFAGSEGNPGSGAYYECLHDVCDCEDGECVHDCETDGCTYVDAVSPIEAKLPVPCNHEHSDACGYAAPTPPPYEGMIHKVGGTVTINDDNKYLKCSVCGLEFFKYQGAVDLYFHPEGKSPQLAYIVVTHCGVSTTWINKSNNGAKSDGTAWNNIQVDVKTDRAPGGDPTEPTVPTEPGLVEISYTVEYYIDYGLGDGYELGGSAPVSIKVSADADKILYVDIDSINEVDYFGDDAVWNHTDLSKVEAMTIADGGVIKVYYTAKPAPIEGEDLYPYIINHYLVDAAGNLDLVRSIPGTAAEGTVITASPITVSAGYVFSPGYADTVASGAVSAERMLVLALFYVLPGGGLGDPGNPGGGGEDDTAPVLTALTTAPAPGGIVIDPPQATISSAPVPLAVPASITTINPPLASSASWALLNLILTIVTGLIMIALMITFFTKRKEDDEQEGKEEKIKKYLALRLITIAATVVAIILFVLTQNMALPMIFIDKWTIYHVIITAATLMLAALSMKKYEEEEVAGQEV